MASKVALERLVKDSKLFKRGAEVARQEIFGNAPQLNIRTGGRRAVKPFTGPYLEKYYPVSIHTYARKIHDNWETELEENRRLKLAQLRRRGAGPPKKGAGGRSKKK